MTERDMILVERVTNGGNCNFSCPCMSIGKMGDYYCSAFENMELIFSTEADGYPRCPACLATPPAPTAQEEQERIEALGWLVEVQEFLLINDTYRRVRWDGVEHLREVLLAARAAAGV